MITDNGEEYIEAEVNKFFRSKGMRHLYTPPYSHQSNRVPERYNRTIQTMVRGMLIDYPDQCLWGEACQVAVYLRNHLPHSQLPQKKTPFEMLYQKQPSIGYLKPFGSHCYIHIAEECRPAGSKLQPRAESAIFVGYTESPLIYKVQLANKHMFTVRAVNCIFTEPTQASPANTSIYPSSELPINESSSSSHTVSIDLPYGLLTTALAVNKNEPKTFKQATECADSPRWYKAMQDELQLLADQAVWTVVPLPLPQHNIVGCKWVYKIKRDAAGEISRYKARLVAQEYSQQPGIDFDEIFSPVVRYDSLRLLIALSISLGWKQPDQLDIKGAFLYGFLNEEIYMKLPPGYEVAGSCVRLNKSIYGLKQSSRQWYQRLTGFLLPLGFMTANFDPCILIHKDYQLIVAIYIDDITLAGPDRPQRENLKKLLKQEFEFSDLGPLTWLLGIQVEWQEDSATLSQRTYIDQLLVRFGMNTCNPISLPLDPNKFKYLLQAQDGDNLADVSQYQQIVGSLMYLVIGTRPDLAFTVSALSQFCSKPTQQHMGTLKQVLRYLKGTRNLTLTYRKPLAQSGNVTLSGYSDSDYAGDRNTRKSTTGYIFQLAGNTVCWRSIRQRNVSTSTVEAEYVALSTTAKQQIWLQNALKELRIDIPAALNTDNIGSIDLTNNPRISDKSKHIDIAYHHVRNLVQDGIINLLHVASQDNLADICTKALPRPQFCVLRDNVCVRIG